jgi:electron transport complex protein RnfE
MSTPLEQGPTSATGEFRRGFVTRNPVFATTVGLCPSLAVTAVVQDTFVLAVVVASTLLITALAVSLLRAVVQTQFRLLVTLSITSVLTIFAELIVGYYAPAVRSSLGIYLPLIAVNALVVSQAQSVSWTSNPLPAIADAAGRALGFAVGLLVIAVFREVLGSGSITLRAGGDSPLVYRIPWLSDHPVGVLSSSVGAFLIVGYLTAAIRAIRTRFRETTREEDA